MAGISASMVKDLREKTGVGMMECKKALEESGGDMEKAIIWLREKGLSRAAKKADRVAAEGLVEVLVSNDLKSACLLELNCETDFASKNDEFRALAAKAAKVAMEKGLTETKDLLAATVDGATFQEHLTQLIAKVGENMTFRRLKVVKASSGFLAGYSHMGGKIGTLIHLSGEQTEASKEAAKDVAMHIAALSPRFLNKESVPPSEVALEKDIATKRFLEQGKSPDIIEKMLLGFVKKFQSEVCLVEQPFVKDPNLTVAAHLEKVQKGMKAVEFARFALGEGIEKKKDDFAAEVAAAAGLKN